MCAGGGFDDFRHDRARLFTVHRPAPTTGAVVLAEARYNGWIMRRVLPVATRERPALSDNGRRRPK